MPRSIQRTTSHFIRAHAPWLIKLTSSPKTYPLAPPPLLILLIQIMTDSYERMREQQRVQTRIVIAQMVHDLETMVRR